MEITRGRVRKAIKCVLYGQEGVGKSTFASMAPNPLWCDVEDSTSELDVARLQPKPTSYTAVMEQIAYVRANPYICDTFVLDTADWAERLAQKHICDANGKKAIEDFNYGAGFNRAHETFGAMLNALDTLIAVGVNVIVLAHAALRRVDLPNEDGSFDRWELKLQNSQKANNASMLKEWADIVLFAMYKTYVVKKDDKEKVGKAKGGQQRVMYTTHHACWDAKNRHGLPEELPLDFGCVAHLFPSKSLAEQNYNALCDRVEQAQQMPQAAPVVAQPMQVAQAPVQQAPITPATIPAAQGQEMAVEQQQVTMKDMINQVYPFDEQLPDTVVKPLADLMRMNVVSSAEIQDWTVGKGYFPAGMPLGDYPADYQHHIVAQWQFIMAEIKQNRKNK
jgi:hypothetical protein